MLSVALVVLLLLLGLRWRWRSLAGKLVELKMVQKGLALVKHWGRRGDNTKQFKLDMVTLFVTEHSCANSTLFENSPLCHPKTELSEFVCTHIIGQSFRQSLKSLAAQTI